MSRLILTPADAAVRVASRASGLIILAEPRPDANATASVFTHPVAALQTDVSTAAGKIEIERVPTAADPLRLAVGRKAGLVTVLADASILVPGVSHLRRLAHQPAVLHVAVSSPAGYAAIAAVRQSGCVFLQSKTVQETADIAVTAYALATRTGKAVVHFFDATSSSEEKQGNEVAEQIDSLVSRLGPFEIQSDPTSEQSDQLQTLYLADQTGPSQPGTDENTDNNAGSADNIPVVLSDIWKTIDRVSGRKYSAFDYTGSSDAETVLVVFGASAVFTHHLPDSSRYGNVGIVNVRLFRPWIGTDLVQAVPASVKRIGVVEDAARSTTRWGPVLLDVLSSVQEDLPEVPIVGYWLADLEGKDDIANAVSSLFDNIVLDQPVQGITLGTTAAAGKQVRTEQAVDPPVAENAYYKVLQQLFPGSLYLVNRAAAADAGLAATAIANSPEFGLGHLLARSDARLQLAKTAKTVLLEDKDVDDSLSSALTNWVSTQARQSSSDSQFNSTAPTAEAETILKLIGSLSSSAGKQLADQKELFRPEVPWIVGSDAWAYDIGNSGVHHLLASGKNVNMLIIDNTPLPPDGKPIVAERRKKDIGLYAMNFGNAFVASVAVYSSYSLLLDALLDASKFNGPSIVLAYLPSSPDSDSPIGALRETKRAVESGFWPLYRWSPNGGLDDQPSFRLDSDRLRRDHQTFVDRQNFFSRLMKRQPELAPSLQNDFGYEVRQAQKRQTKDAFDKLIAGLAGAPMTVLFATDNGNAETVGRRLAGRAAARRLKSGVFAMDDFPFDDLAGEQNVIFITSTAGQGEFPQNGRAFWDSLRAATDMDLSKTSFSVFGLGDSHYWPRKEDREYYNKPAKDLDARLRALGATPLCGVGLGDDQDPDGFETGYQAWEPEVWKALGVDNVDGLPDEPAPVTMEDIKTESNFLRGTIAAGLADTSTGAIAEHDQMLTKFHGTYMQDDRDVREQRKADGLEPAYSFMIRCRLPGGVATPQQWIQMDDIADSLGNRTMKLTTRQTFQFHGVVKGKLRPAMQAINQALMTTLAACGDVNRNVMCSSLPELSVLHSQVQKVAQRISDHLLPSTTAYHEIWLTDEKEGKKQVGGDALVDQEPLYGPTYLPRKFKITIAVPPHNDTDVYAHDIGLIAIKSPEDGSLVGFNVLVGGGMGATHNNKKTYPQIGRLIGFTPAEQVHLVCEKVMLVQRDFGDRKNRKHARLKYTVDDLGVDQFRAKVEALLGWSLTEGRPFSFSSNVDTFGWIRDDRGLHHFTVFIENGRIEDSAELQGKSGLRELAEAIRNSTAEFRLTGNQHVIISNVDDETLPTVKAVLARYRLDNTSFSGLRLSSSACVAFPTCGLAMAESERYLPVLVTKLEDTLEKAGLRHDSIVMRMTGCPNGCARPWLAEIGLVGKAYGIYNLYLGGGYHGNRLSKLYRSNVAEDEILAILRPLIWQYSRERLNEDEKFGDFVIRAGVVQKTVEGRDFHLNTAEEESE